jgi:hypothetical protein
MHYLGLRLIVFSRRDRRREAGSQSVIAGATVTVGSASATTAANGHFELQNVPVGSVNVSARANRVDSDIKTIL